MRPHMARPHAALPLAAAVMLMLLAAQGLSADSPSTAGSSTAGSEAAGSSTSSFPSAGTLAAGSATLGSPVLPVPEAPTTIFSTKLGSAEVDLNLQGSWDAAVSFGTGLLFAPNLSGPHLLDSFPAFSQGFVFTQTPDITIELDLLKRFFLSASIIGSFANNYIQAGYRGGPGEALQSVIIGTQGITIPASALMQIPGQPQGSLGIMSKFVSLGSTNDAVIRWDATLPKTKTFIGRNELVEQETGLDGYIRGMYFYLPDTGIDTGTLQVFIEDPNGTMVATDGRRYRVATSNDVVTDSVNGLVSLKNPVKGRVVAYYTKGMKAVGDPTNLTAQFVDLVTTPPIRRNTASPATFNWTVTDNYVLPKAATMAIRQVTIPGVGSGPGLLLWEPGDNSPFEIESSYAFSSHPPSDVSLINIKVNPKAASSPVSLGPLSQLGLVAQPDPPNTRFNVLVNAAAYRNFANFYPFPDPTGLIYGPTHDAVSGSLDYDLLVQMMTPVSTFVLEANIEPGSVQVNVNGMQETRFEVEPVSGTLTPHFDILPTDRIDVTYRAAQNGVSGGDILAAWRSEIPLSDTTNLSVAAGVRWNANPWTFSQQPYSKSGTVIATVGVDGKTEHVEYSAQAGVSYTNPDTTGILRLFGMEGDGTQVDLSEDNWYPASAPDASGTEIGSLLQSNRDVLFYRDYRQYGALGATSLQTIETNPPPSQMAYQNGNRMGPYNVQGSDGNLSAVSLVFEYSLTASGDWVGAQVPISAGSTVDLSSARAISIRLRNGLGPLARSGNVYIYLQLGSTSEDLDGSGVLKAENTAADTGFSFVQGNPLIPVTLKVGAGPQLTGNGKLDSEDTDGNQILDLEDPNRVVTTSVTTGVPATTFPIPDSQLGTAWQSFTYSLTDSDRQKLLGARSVRLVIVANGAGAQGTILVDQITIEGTPFYPVTNPATDKSKVQVQEVTEVAAQAQPSGGDFATRFPSTYSKFHPNNETNQVLETVWSTQAGTFANPFTVQGFVSQGTGGIQYQTVVSYIRADTSGLSYTFSMLDSSGKGIVWSVSPADNTWHEVKVSRKNNTVTVDGTTVSTPTRFDSNYGSLAQLQVSVSGAPLTAAGQGGHLYLDEIYLTDPQGSFGAAFVGSVAAKFPGVILAVGKTPVLSDVALRQDVAAYSGGFAALYGTPYAAEDLLSRSHLDASLLSVRTSLDLALRDQGGSLSASGGHSVTVPAGPISVTDAYSLSTAGGFTREDQLSLAVGSLANLSLDAAANASPDETDTTGLLSQTWQGGLTLTPFAPFSISSSLALAQALSGYTLEPDWYGARWAHEASLILPWKLGGQMDSSDVTRSEKLDFKAGIPAAPFGFTLDASTSAGGSNYTTAGYSQVSALSYGLALLLKLGPGDSADSVGLSYRRSASITTAPGPGPRFQQETGELASVLSQQAYLFQGIPFAEIFSDNTGAALPAWQSANASQGSYSPVVTLSMQRAYGSHLTDLLIPSTVDLALGQELDKNSDQVQATTYVRPKISTHAINLFGQLGSMPRLPMVQTDEYSLSLSGSVDRTTPALYPQYGPGPLLSQVSLQAYASLTAENQGQLTLVETLRRDQTTSVVVSNDAQALLEWRVNPAAGVPLPLLPADIGATGHFEHRESAEVTVGYQDSGAFHPFTLLLGHATSIVYPGHGSIKASLDLGMDVQDLVPGFAWRFAIRASIEAKLTF